MTAVAVAVRELRLADLTEVEAIERRAYRTPWSRSMFASELAKPTSICLGAFEGEQLVGYVINSRYVDAWHVMNVAVDPDYQRRGIATPLLERVFEVTAGDDRRGYTLEVRVSNADAIRLYEKLGFERRGTRRGLLHRQPRGRADHVARREARAVSVPPGRRAEKVTHLSRSGHALVTPFRLRFVRVVPPGGRGSDRVAGVELGPGAGA